MKKRIILLIIIAYSFCISSCKKFLNEDPKGLLYTNNFFTTDAKVNAAVIGIIAAVRNEITSSTPPYYMLEIISDDAQLGGTLVSERYNLDQLKYNASSTYIQAVWTNCYTVINNANTVINYTDSSLVTPNTCRLAIGQARFWRAYSYFELVRLWGGVPLVLTPSTSNNLFPSRATTVDVYNQIIADLQYAEQVLPSYYAYSDPVNGGCASQVTAKALLGLVYLTMSGFPLQDASKLPLASTELNGIITNSSKYNVGLMSPYSSIFNPQLKTSNQENLFYFQGTYGLASNANGGSQMNALYGTYSEAIPTRVVDTAVFASGDARKAVCFNSAGTGIVKYGTTATPTTLQTAYDFHVIRYSDVLLMYAETLIEQETNTTSTTPNLDMALNIINQIRVAHGGSSLRPLSYSNQSDLRAKYRAERRSELLYEGHRLYDLLRWGIFVPTVQAQLANQTKQPIDAFNYITSDYNLLPIPFYDINLNPNLTQNPGWQ